VYELKISQCHLTDIIGKYNTDLSSTSQIQTNKLRSYQFYTMDSSAGWELPKVAQAPGKQTAGLYCKQLDGCQEMCRASLPEMLQTQILQSHIAFPTRANVSLQ
jgi:hypothetical protein